MAALILFDLSAVFDIIDHITLNNRLSSWYGISCTALDWFTSYLSDRCQQVKIQDYISDAVYIYFGIPQGSFLRPILLDRSMPGKNCHLFLSRFSQWIQLPETILFEISFWATLKYSSNPIWRPKSKMAAILPKTVTFWAFLC